MSYLHTGGFVLAATLLSACVPAGNVVNPWVPYPTYPTPAPTPSYVDVYKYQGSRQCEGGGVPLAEMQRQLQAAGVRVQAAACGTDGRMYPAFCGGADGRINILSIPTKALPVATAQGFTPLSQLPDAQKSNCYGNSTYY